jgi:hypothetical protein
MKTEFMVFYVIAPCSVVVGLRIFQRIILPPSSRFNPEDGVSTLKGTTTQKTTNCKVPVVWPVFQTFPVYARSNFHQSSEL